MRRPGVDDAYRLAWRSVRHLPSPLGYGLFDLGADLVWATHRLRGGDKGVGQLERNLARLMPGAGTAEVSKVSRAGMRSYMRYFYEAFAMPGWSPQQVLARVRVETDPSTFEDVARDSVVIALPHMGNWDLVAAWACQEMAQVLTVAERLEPADLFEQFVAFRESLGMRVIGQAHGEKVFDSLVEAASQGRYVIALLADRDLSSSGVEVPLAGHDAHVAAGPAALADRLDLPLYTGSMHYERLSGERRRAAGSRWGLVLTLVRVPAPEGLSGREKIAEWTRRWAAQASPYLVEHAVDWHMLQPVFDADLDQERLARSRARQAASSQQDTLSETVTSQPQENA